MEGEIIKIKDRGQSLVLLAIMMFVLMGMLALIIDGGMAYAQRRAAQNAADAAALAGAEEMCKGSSETAIRQMATNYVNNNGAEIQNVSDILISGSTITVTAHISYENFIARVINQPNMNVAAKAAAGCMTPCEAVVLPVAWACKLPIGTSTIPLNECKINLSDLDAVPPEIHRYLFADNIKNDYPCAPAGTTPGLGYLDCDLDNYCPSGPTSCTNDVIGGGGQRDWLALEDDSCSEADLKRWVNPNEGFGGTLAIHTWTRGCIGDKDVTYKEIAKWDVGLDVILPIYNEICPDDPSTNASCVVHSNDTIYHNIGGASPYYHIIDFSKIHLTCVQTGDSKSKVTVDPAYPQLTNDICPEREAFIAANAALGLDKNNMKTVEGFFITASGEEFHGACGEGNPTGTYTVYLK